MQPRKKSWMTSEHLPGNSGKRSNHQHKDSPHVLPFYHIRVAIHLHPRPRIISSSEHPAATPPVIQALWMGTSVSLCGPGRARPSYRRHQSVNADTNQVNADTNQVAQGPGRRGGGDPCGILSAVSWLRYRRHIQGWLLSSSSSKQTVLGSNFHRGEVPCTR